MRLLATLTGPGPAIVARTAVATVITVATVVVLVLGAATATFAADPTPATGGGAVAPPTCSERYPQEGPAGLDLRLGCIIGELVGHYTAGTAKNATPASTYALVVIAIAVAGLVAAWVAGRLIGRAAGRRLAPVRPDEWWLCASCRSVNAAGVRHCYSCGAPPPDGPLLRTDDAPTTPQSFGSTRKRG